MTALRESNYLATTPTYWPRGVECILDYNNSACVLNDLRRADQIVVTSIGGLGGPDLSAGADKNPGRDGESPQDATYGGRTITLRGYVKSGSVDGMRKLFSYLLDGFDTVTEAPLWFRYLDWRDQFVDSTSLVDYAYDAGTGTVTIATDGSGLQPTSTVNKAIRLLPLKNDGTSPSRFTYGDGEAIIKFKAGTSLTGLVAGVELRRASSTVKLRVIYEKATDTIRVYKINAGTTQLATAASTTLVVGTNYWLRVRAEGAVITTSLWTTYPPDTGTTGQLATLSHTLSAGDQTLFPASTSGQGWLLYWTPNSTTDRIGLFDVGALNPGDAIVNCRKNVPIEPGDETQADYEWRRDFMITLRASSALMMSRKITLVSTSPPTPALVQEYLTVSVTNLGRSTADMLLTFDKGSGQVMAPNLYVPTTNDRVGTDAPIGVAGSVFEPDVDTLIFNTSDRTVVDELGRSRYALLGSYTTWPQIPRGVNSLQVTSERSSSFEGFVAASALNAKTFWGAEAWATSGSATDWATSNIVTLANQLPAGRVEYMSRTTTADAGNGRIGLAGTTTYTDATAYIQFRLSVLPFSGGGLNEISLITRYVDASNYFRTTMNFLTGGSSNIFYYRKIAGVDTLTGALALSSTIMSANTWYEMATAVRSDGRFRTQLIDAVTRSVLWSDDLLYDLDFFTTAAASWPLSHSTLATAGTLATGRIGMLDKNNTGIASNREIAKLGIRSAMVGGRVDISYRHSSR